MLYVSPEVVDPDNQLGEMTFKIDPAIDCKCLKIKQIGTLVKITLDNEKLKEKNLGKYSIEIEFFDQQKKKIFGAGG